MMALWMTPAKTARPARKAGQGSALSCLATFGFGLILLGVFGCGREPLETTTDESVAVEPEAFPSERPLMANLPPPRAEWIEYSAKDRKLNMYQLRASGRWMVKRPDRDTPYPIGPEHVLPDGLDAGETYIFYTRPGGQSSRSITLAQVQAATREHVSFAR